MSRIIAGDLRGRTLTVPRSGTRPTSDRVREAVFSALDSRGAIRGASVLDLYAGSGALGFESLSRGAASLTAVEAARPAMQVLKANARMLGVRPQLVNAKVATFLAAGIARVQGAPFDLVFLDPPYELDVSGDLRELADGDWMSQGGLAVVERSVRSPQPEVPERFGEPTEKKYGDTVIWLLRAGPGGEERAAADGQTTLGT
ncbi:MAG TPA: 16S rRNA (guanine(966)-N(2))-methyltransferase RsmD [Actinomycetales bacterium]|nr:16S rRNA (guanine(966)-N(2))-methyltransferase RsmD [Actinomycetales bacterium]